jgi:hypothetical protein
LNQEHKKVIFDILHCKTAIMGGHWQKCPNCEATSRHYNSCGNRHCPCCQGFKKEKWILERRYDSLPVKYFHVVFTVPAQIRRLFFHNQEILYNLLFHCSWHTLKEFGFDKRGALKAQMGAVAILHTWTQKLAYHPHVHFMVPNGGINKYNKWKKSKGTDNFLFYVPALADKFRGKFLDNLYRLFLDNKLNLNGKLQTIAAKNDFYQFKDSLYNKKWVVYSKASFKDVDSLLEYQARYTHKIAISNFRISDIDKQNRKVTFSYLDREDNYSKKFLSLSADKFIARFLSHVLPKGYIRIRHFGFLACRVKKQKLKIIRKVLKAKEPGEKPKLNFRIVMILSMGIDPLLCKKCKKAIMVIYKISPRIRGKPYFHYPGI